MSDKSKLRKNRFSTIARVLLFYLCSVLVLMFTSRVAKALPPNVGDIFSVFFASALTIGLVYLFTQWEKLRLRDIGVVPGKKTIQRFVTGYVIGISMAVLQAMIVFGFGHLKFTLAPNITVAQIAFPLLLYFLVACREELVFRSYSLRSLAWSLSPAVALTIVTVIFILEHVMAGSTWKMAVIGSGFGGILFGVAALKTKGLSLPLGLHFAWNFGQWMVGFKNASGVWNAVVEKGFETETENISLAAFAVVMLLSISGLISFYKRKASGAWPMRG